MSDGKMKTERDRILSTNIVQRVAEELDNFSVVEGVVVVLHEFGRINIDPALHLDGTLFIVDRGDIRNGVHLPNDIEDVTNYEVCESLCILDEWISTVRNLESAA